MSTTVSTSAMVAILTRRIPGLDPTLAMEALNAALRWVNQKGSFVWQLHRASVTVSGTVGTEGEFSMPADFDPGKEAILYGAANSPTPTEIPKMAWADAVKRQLYQTGVSAAESKAYGAWTFFSVLTGSAITFKGQIVPKTAVPAAGDATLLLIYHRVTFPVLTSGASTYFPTPDHFDSLIIDIAEAELLREYRMAGWDTAYKRVQEQIMPMLDGYKSIKNTMLRTTEALEVAQLKQAMRG